MLPINVEGRILVLADKTDDIEELLILDNLTGKQLIVPYIEVKSTDTYVRCGIQDIIT